MATPQIFPEPIANGPAVVTPRTARKSRTKPYLYLMGAAAIGLLAYAIVAWLSRGKESTDDAAVDADAVTLSTRVAGAVLKVHVSDNQQVRRGDLLVEIDPSEHAARVRQAEAELAAARAQAQAADA
ncbi:MAG: biotin/lipoyl-binding protein, partial [Myxococcota bacterium]|nr:biotin/lipoyl-binding protein [Myxococcota bacterium]